MNLKRNLVKALAFIMLDCVFFALSTGTAYAQNRVIIPRSCKTVQQVMNSIEKQTGFSFFYNNTRVDVNRNITLPKKKISLDNALEQLFDGTDISYRISGKSIFLVNNIKKDLAESTQDEDQGAKKKVLGYIKDKNGEPIIGASVSIKGMSLGTVTDLDGKYELDANADDIIEVSYIGYQKQAISIGNKNILNVTLKEDTKALDEVVVIGYGTQKKSDLTGSLSSVSSKDIEKMPVTNLATAMQGKVPGATISNVSGSPGSSLKIRVRGANSVNGDNEPLCVIDGIVGSIDGINVNDVEHVEILKDASATAIYGSRGANGVVLITTKQGAKGEKPKITFTVNEGISSLPKKYDLLNAGDFATLANVYSPGHFTDAQITNYKQNGGVDWQDEVFRTGKTQDYQVNVSGGSNNSSYFISGNYVDQSGIVENTKMSKYAFRTNITSQIADNMSLTGNLFYSRSKGLNASDAGSKGSPVWLATIFPPTFNIYTDEGKWNQVDNFCGPNYGNPLMQLKERRSDYIKNYVTANFKYSWNIIKDLRLDVVFGVDFTSLLSGSVSNLWVAQTTSATEGEAKNYNWQNSNILTYDKTFAKIHHLTVTAVNEQSSYDTRYINCSGTGIDPISVGYDNLGLAETKNASTSHTKYTLQSYLGRVSYSLMDRYLITASLRADGTSKFQGSNKWGYFPSAALAWRVSEEPFMKAYQAVSNLKLRLSWGKTGNQGIDPHATLVRVGNWSQSYGQSSMYPGTYYVGADNPDLKWETTEQTNFGFDLGLFGGRLNVSADYYNKNTSDLLLGVSIPAYNGGGTVNRNIGKVNNKGFEVNVTATPISQKDFTWDLGANLSYYKNEIKNLGNETFILSSTIPIAGTFQKSPFALQVGKSMGSFYGYTWEGIYKSSEATEAAKYGFKPGDNKYKDLNNDGSIDSQDQSIIGCSLPKVVWGLDNTFTYKNFSLNIMLQSALGRKVLNSVYASNSTIFADATAITSKDGANYWTADNENALFANITSSTSKNFMASTEYLQNGSYVKVKNISLSYFLSRNIVKFADFKFTFSAQNVFTFTKYKGYDPETSTTSSDVDGAIDVGAYPNPRSFTLSVQMSL